MYIPSLADWGNCSVVKKETALGAKTACVSVCVISGVKETHECLWVKSTCSRLLLDWFRPVLWHRIRQVLSIYRVNKLFSLSKRLVFYYDCND